MFSYLKQSSEVRHYLKHFANSEADRFAVIKVTGDLLHLPGEAERVASALVFLHRVGLIPVVVHGAGLFSGERADEVERALRDAMQTLDTDQATTATATSAHSSQTLSPAGRRRLRSQASRLALQEAEAYMHRANSALCTAIEALGVSAAPMLSGCFEAELDEDATGPEAGIIGRIVGVNTAAIHDAVALGSVPVVAALALNPHTHAGDEDAVEAEHGDGTLTFSTWSASEALARDLKPLKIVILRPDGGFLNPDGSRLARISLARDLIQLCPPATSEASTPHASMEEAAASMALAFAPESGLGPPPSPLPGVVGAEPHWSPGLELLRSSALSDTDGEAVDGAAASEGPASPLALPETLAFPSTLGNLLAIDIAAGTAEGALVTPHREVMESRALPASEQAILREVAGLFEACDLEPGATIAITSPEHLASELFTERGRGTLVVRGEAIVEYDSLDAIGRPALAALLEEAFGKKLPEAYFESISPKLLKIYASATLRGAAIVTKEGSFPYLDKFAVSPSAQGDKLGDDVWHALVSGQPELLWRSRSDNRVNSWYFERSHGSYTNHTAARGKFPKRDADSAESSGSWTVFWRGVADARIMDAVRTALQIPKTFN